MVTFRSEQTVSEIKCATVTRINPFETEAPRMQTGTTNGIDPMKFQSRGITKLQHQNYILTTLTGTLLGARDAKNGHYNAGSELPSKKASIAIFRKLPGSMGTF